jgi:uncharacterized membrane protein YkoI
MQRGWRHWTGRILPVLAVALLALGPVHAKESDKKKQKEAALPTQILPKNPPQAETREPARSTKRVSIDRVIEQVEKRHKARVVRAEQKEKDGRAIYELKLLSDDGRVWTVKVDAETGKEA